MRVNSVQRWIISAGLAVTVAIAVVGVNGLLQSASADTSIPAVVKPCIPNRNVPSRVLAKGRNANKNYYLVGVNDTPASHFEMYDALIEVAGNHCRELLGSPHQSPESLSTVIPLALAKQLQLQRYRLWVSEVGKDRFQQLLNQNLSEPGTSRLSLEVHWALQQLGLKVPQ